MPGVLSRFNETPPFVLSVDGRKLGPAHEAPTVSEVARGLGKLCRFAGNSRVFWPVLLHSMVVADLVSDDIKLYALLHDAAEVVFNDIPTPFKPLFFEPKERAVLRKLYANLEVPEPSEDILRRVKVADIASLTAEAVIVGPRGLSEYYPGKDAEAEARVLQYLHLYREEDYLREGGIAVLDFEARVRAAVDSLKT